MVFFSIMAHQAYACAAFWTYGAEMTMVMYKCANNSMDAYLSALGDMNGTIKPATDDGVEQGRTADVIPFPAHRLGSFRAE
ncbi:hypothetical protein N825_30085 [Skermanella stibiiresistens SB22]|uniref:Uncharacterized protein n=1 Tax=Skermanella stibiiresistens SB22 TaxID=1385369 RepID=W9GX44_9PROT|nr:hypothetical protein [Skermanella stibiiresistens]EWY36058.1 hypothetical protein N825_30085 [Skermanella stibiiresistens SB22]